MKLFIKISIFLGIILTILSIVSQTRDIFGIPQIKDWSILQPEEASPIRIIFEPESINEGQYPPGFPFRITLPNIRKNNITELKLSQQGVTVDRFNKNDQTKVSSIYWKDFSSYNEFIFNHHDANYPPDFLVANGVLNGCDNCFMGEKSPYIFTFVIQYVKNKEPIKTEPITITVPIN